MSACALRPAADTDLDRLVAIAAAGDGHGVDTAHLCHVQCHGRLVVADDPEGAHVVGFGGVVEVPANAGPVVMVSDLFVDPAWRGRGIGGDLLTRLVDRYESRMTCSSHHPAALAAYRRVGMAPRWPVRTMRGRAPWGETPDVVSRGRRGATRGVEATGAAWRHGRDELVARFAASGAEVGADHILTRTADTVVVHRVCSAAAVDVVAALLDALPPTVSVTLSVPAPHPLGEWLDEHGFVEISTDVFCATPDIEIDPHLAVVDLGLW